jgi:signal transduction histidine kinase
MLSPLAEAKGLSLTWEAQGPLSLYCDRRKCKQILVNLVCNGIKFTTRGGVQIYARRDPTEPRIGRLSVSDTGTGIRPEDVPRLFQEFEQLETPVEGAPAGSGLGLSLSRKLARLMGGDIEVQSEYGQGSTFTLRLGAAD